MAEQPNVLLNVTNRAENVLVVREMLTGVALALALDEHEVNDLLTAATEACNNVVLHAYEGEEGPLEVEVTLTRCSVAVVVRDHGTGIQTQSAVDKSMLGIGLPVIQALVSRVELRDGPRGGTEVCMEFTAPSNDALDALLGAEKVEPLRGAPETPAGTSTVAIAPVELARSVLPRILSTLAARAHFSTDRISDMQMMTDALVAHARGSLGAEHLRIAVTVEPRNLELQIGPLGAGRAQRLVGESDLDGLGRIIEKLADRHSVVSAGAHETLTLELADRRQRD
jgi:serine/threonine-protein kinase RsbW